MVKGWLAVAAWLCAAAVAGTALCQTPKEESTAPSDGKMAKSWCSCGAHPPGPEPVWTAKPYANVPEDLEPYARFVKPYNFYYLQPTIWNGPGRNLPPPRNLTEVRIGFVGPISLHDPDYVMGTHMLQGVQLAIDEANARGGYGGKPFRLMLHDDYNNWQAGAVGGNVRPTNPAIWGAGLDPAVQCIYDDKDWAIFGSISSETTHEMLRLALKAEIPIVNSASTDPTIPETSVPWYFTDLQDDRVQGYTLARRIYTQLGLKSVAILRVNNRYGRMGIVKFHSASLRLGHPVIIEQTFTAGTTDFSRELRNIQDSRADAIVLWTDEAPAAMILKQMRAMGMKQPVFGSYRTLGPTLLAQAGSAAEGFEAVFPYDPTRTDPNWIDFNRRFEARFHEAPDQLASLAYDAMNILLDSICRAGLNRVRIQDALDDVRQYDGVTGHMVFDPNRKNVAPMYLGTVHDGKITYRLAPMSKSQTAEQAPEQDTEQVPEQKTEQAPAAKARAGQLAAAHPVPAPTPYARVGEDGIHYFGPAQASVPRGPLRAVLFGPQAEKLAHSPAIKAQLAAAAQRGRAWLLLPVDSDQQWGVASTQLVRSLWNEHALAIIALGRKAGHLSEQLALKTFVPVVAVSDDRTLTSAAVPWIFRLPTGTSALAALRLLTDAEARGGPNPERVRDVLASGDPISGFAFLPSGDPRVQ